MMSAPLLSTKTMALQYGLPDSNRDLKAAAWLSFELNVMWDF